MSGLRIILFLGLLAHKLLWEVLKARSALPKRGRVALRFSAVSIVKAIKGAALIFLLIQTLFLDIFPISQDPQSLIYIGVMIYSIGLATAAIGRIQLGQNWVDLEDYQVLPEQSLVTEGIYRFVRHPIYVGDIALFIGLELALNSWLVLGAFLLIVIVLRQTQAEEAMLTKIFPEYRAYSQRTKRFIPSIL